MPPLRKEARSSLLLLLLPPAPFPPDFAAIKAAYYPPLLDVLRKLSSKSQGPAILDIALPCHYLSGKKHLPRSITYETTQKLVAGLYKLICVIAAQEAIDTEDADGIDARILLLAYPRNGKLIQGSETTTSEADVFGPVIDLHTLARSPRIWEQVFAVESEQGEQLLKNFVSLRPTEVNARRVSGGLVQVSRADTQASSISSRDDAREHLSVAVGGTFDHLHIGHKLLLTMFAFILEPQSSQRSGEAEKCLTIGITGDELLKNKQFSEFLESWKARQQAVHHFLTAIMDVARTDDNGIQEEEKTEPGPNGHAVHVKYPWGLIIKYVEIWDPFGPTITDKVISALVLSAETRGGGQAVNTKRGEQGWDPLDVFEVDVLDAGEEDILDETFQNKLSSTEIRRQHSERRRSQTEV